MEITNIPKIELHIHLSGAYPEDYLKKIAKKEDYIQLKNFLKLINARKIDYNSVFNVFNIINRIVDNEDKVMKGVYQLCKNLVKEKIIYMELRTGLKDLGKGKEAYLRAIIEGIRKAEFE